MKRMLALALTNLTIWVAFLVNAAGPRDKATAVGLFALSLVILILMGMTLQRVTRAANQAGA